MQPISSKLIEIKVFNLRELKKVIITTFCRAWSISRARFGMYTWTASYTKMEGDGVGALPACIKSHFSLQLHGPSHRCTFLSLLQLSLLARTTKCLKNKPTLVNTRGHHTRERFLRAEDYGNKHHAILV